VRPFLIMLIFTSFIHIFSGFPFSSCNQHSFSVSIMVMVMLMMMITIIIIIIIIIISGATAY
jgi:hypothetical protein